MTAGKQEIWQLLEPLVKESGVEVYDIEPPTSRFGTLRIFIWKGPASVKGGGLGITIDQCASVSRRISDWNESAAVLPEDWSLEVSSPGVNRKLIKVEHFSASVGERVKVKIGGASADAIGVADEQKGKSGTRTLVGKLLSFDGERLVIEDEKLNQEFSVGFCDVRQGQVDFKFGGGDR